MVIKNYAVRYLISFGTTMMRIVSHDNYKCHYPIDYYLMIYIVVILVNTQYYCVEMTFETCSCLKGEMIRY